MKLNSLEAYQGQINSVTDRQAMGVPESYVELAIEDLKREFDIMRKLDRNELVEVCESKEQPFKIRYAASSMLGLIGDPRINVIVPNMKVIPSAIVKIGLAEDRIDAIYEKYKDSGWQKVWIYKEAPQIEIEISKFQLSKYLVTNFEYLQYLKENPNGEIPSNWKFGRYPSEASNLPVYTLTCQAAENYCGWLSKKTGRKFRLPTEFEWEYAAAGADGLEFPWGDEFLKDHANTLESGIFSATPVGIFPKGFSNFGLADMAGNVEEYTASFYRPYSGTTAVQDDLAIKHGEYRIARGGSFTRFRELARCKRRHGYFPRDIYVMGFRLAESI